MRTGWQYRIRASCTSSTPSRSPQVTEIGDIDSMSAMHVTPGPWHSVPRGCLPPFRLAREHQNDRIPPEPTP